eukprot:767207-Hanusia_phi.AAC.3
MGQLMSTGPEQDEVEAALAKHQCSISILATTTDAFRIQLQWCDDQAEYLRRVKKYLQDIANGRIQSFVAHELVAIRCDVNYGIDENDEVTKSQQLYRMTSVQGEEFISKEIERMIEEGSDSAMHNLRDIIRIKGIYLLGSEFRTVKQGLYKYYFFVCLNAYKSVFSSATISAAYCGVLAAILAAMIDVLGVTG